MKPPERFPSDDPREWLNRARSNMVRAKLPVPDVYLEDLCFDAQQAAEKAIKAVMIVHGIDFPYTHDLARLLTILEARGEHIPDTVRRAVRPDSFGGKSIIRDVRLRGVDPEPAGPGTFLKGLASTTIPTWSRRTSGQTNREERKAVQWKRSTSISNLSRA
jgi:HEPN domain-containing protein